MISPPPIPRRTLGAALALVAMGGRARAASDDLVAAARKEGSLVWYTSLVENQAARPLVQAFEKKYPGIHVQLVAGTVGDLLSKLLAEGRAGSMRADVHHGGSALAALTKAGLVERYVPDAAADYPAELKDPQGYWTAQLLSFLTPAINTDMVAEAQVPKTLDDLLDPRWVGKIAWTTQMTQGGPPGFIGTILHSRGEKAGMEYLQRLGRQRVVNVPANQRVVLDHVLGGEYPLALCTFNNHSAISRKDGAPVRALTLEPVTGTLDTIFLLKGPSPNAGRLFIDYTLSIEGQTALAKATYIPAHPRVPATDASLKPETGHFKMQILTPPMVEAGIQKWIGIYNELFK